MQEPTFISTPYDLAGALVLRSYHHVTVGLTADHVWGDTGTGGAHEAFGSGTTQFGIYLNEPSVVQRPTGAASVGAQCRGYSGTDISGYIGIDDADVAEVDAARCGTIVSLNNLEGSGGNKIGNSCLSRGVMMFDDHLNSDLRDREFLTGVGNISGNPYVNEFGLFASTVSTEYDRTNGQPHIGAPC